MTRTAAITWVRRSFVAVAFVVAVAGMGSVLAVSLASKFGFQTFGMKTGSMIPVIRPGDLVVDRLVDPSRLRPGQVITFRRPGAPDEVYSHRIAAITYSGGQEQITTRGDANRVVDPWRLVVDGAALQEVTVIRHGGIVLHVAQSPTVRRLIAASVFVLALVLLWPVLVTTPRRQSAATPGSEVAPQ